MRYCSQATNISFLFKIIGPLLSSDMYFNCYVLQLPAACEQYRMIHSAKVVVGAPSDLKTEVGRLLDFVYLF